MRFWPFSRKAEPEPEIETKAASLESVLRQVAAMYETISGTTVNAETCMQSPTVHAIVTAVQNRLAVSPVKVLRKTVGPNGRTRKDEIVHPVNALLATPNTWQTSEEYFGDAASSLLRSGRYFAAMTKGQTGPIRELIPIVSGEVAIKRDRDTLAHWFEYNNDRYLPMGREGRTGRRMHYARLGARDYLKGDSPIDDVRESIGLEIVAEKFAASFFGNGAAPALIFSLLEGARDFETDEERTEFLRGVNQAFTGNKRFSSMLLPDGMKVDPMKIENDKAQFIETRRFIRTVIAGAFGVPPHLVGDLERATFNNVEQQDTDFVINVVLPIAKRLEAAMERDFLNDKDRLAGVIIRFNLDAVQRADIKTRNDALSKAREWGAINVNEWREHLNMNPIRDDEGGEDYLRPLNYTVAGDEPPEENAPNPLRVVRPAE